MRAVSSRALFWALRALSILFIGFVSLFALDVFQEAHGSGRSLSGSRCTSFSRKE